MGHVMHVALRHVISSGLSAAAPEEAGDDLPDWAKDPEKVAYLKSIIDAAYNGRNVVASYKMVVLVVILVFSALHWRTTRRDRIKWLARSAG